MSVSMSINGSETGVIRVFHVDLPKEAIERFTTQAGTGEWPLQYALGAKTLRPGYVDVVALSDLAPMTLSQYLWQAHDLAGPEFEAMKPQLDGLKGCVVVLPSLAFDRVEQDLSIAAPLRWVATFNEPKPAMKGAPIKTASAQGSVNTADPERHLDGRGVPGWLWFALVVFILGVFAVFGFAV